MRGVDLLTWKDFGRVISKGGASSNVKDMKACAMAQSRVLLVSRK